MEKAYIPDDWARIVSSCKTKKPFQTVQMKENDFLFISLLSLQRNLLINLKNRSHSGRLCGLVMEKVKS